MNETVLLEVRDLTVRAGPLTLVDRVSLTLREGDWLMVAGPNGAGKSTLLEAITKGDHGHVLLDGRPVERIPPPELARAMGVLSQQHDVNYSFTVEEVAALGRYSHSKMLAGPSAADQEKIALALKLTGLQRQRRQSVLTLSGGELQRAFLAQLFAQDPRILLLDEPTNHLDLQYQSQLFELIEQWRAQSGRAVLSVVHDLSMARLYGNRAMLMDQGRIRACGEKEAVFTPEHLNAVYHMDVYQWMDRLHRPWQT